MSTSERHYKFINSKTGNAIFYHSVTAGLTADELKEELRRIEEQVARQNGLNVNTIYWQEVTEGEER